jgi:hypothetical protein
MFYQAEDAVKVRSHNVLKKEVYQRLGDVCIGVIEDTF